MPSPSGIEGFLLQDLLSRRPDAAGRLELLEIDTSSEESIAKAAATVEGKYGKNPSPLYGIINNAGTVCSCVRTSVHMRVRACVQVSDCMPEHLFAYLATILRL